MKIKFLSIVSLLLAVTMCLGTGISVMADDEEEAGDDYSDYSTPTDNDVSGNSNQDSSSDNSGNTDWNSGNSGNSGWNYSYEEPAETSAYLNIAIDGSREYKTGDMVNIYIDCSSNITRGAIYYTISPSSYQNYFSQSGNSLYVVQQPSQATQITVTANYNVGSLYLSDSASFTLAAEVRVDPLSVSLSSSGSSSFSVTAGETFTVAANVSGGAYGASYSMNWSCSSSLSLVSQSNYGYASFKANSADTNAYVSVSVSSGYDTANAQLYGTVKGAAEPFWIELNSSSLKLDAGASTTVIAGGKGGTTPYRYTWESSDSSVIRVAAGTQDDSVCTVVAVKAGTATITCRAYDSQGSNDVASCQVTVVGSAYNIIHNATGTVQAGSRIYISEVLASIFNEYRRQTGTELTSASTLTIGTTSNTYGSIRYSNGTIISSSSSAYSVSRDAYFLGASVGTFYSYYSIEETNGNTISGNITISVTAPTVKVSSVAISAYTLQMPTWSTKNIGISVTPSNASYEVTWSTDNSNIVTVSGSGNNVTLSSKGLYGSTIISARVKDLSNNQYTTVSCTVSVQNASSQTYNPELTLTYGSDYNGTSVSDSIARQFLTNFGITLGTNATVRFGSTGNTKGTLFLYNGNRITANTNYSFRDLQLMSFTPNDVGTFSIPYSVTYSNYTLSGTMYFYINGTKLTVTPSTTSLTLDTYSSQYVYMLISPSNAYYTIEWTTDNSSVATITEKNTYYTTINSKGIAGTTTVKTTIKDANGISTVKNITVTVRNSGASDYNPSTITTIGSTTAGTTVYDSLRSQFRSVYGITLPDTATISFGSSDSAIAIRRLSSGTEVAANTKYTMAQYKDMYTQPLAAGTWTTPYTVTYNSQTLSGKITVNITPANATASITLNDSNPYSFSADLANTTGAALLKSDITNAVSGSGLTASYIRITTPSNGNGTLYADSNRTAITDKTNISVDSFGSLYFVPGSAGTYSTIFHAYDAKGNEIAAGYLYIIVPESDTGVTVVATTQNVTVDGKAVDAEIYNINGENYFKLRDVAQMLKGTNSQFSVGFNDETRTITVNTGSTYTSLGTELVKGEDKSSTCVPSTMPIFVNGASVSPTAYNIGGNNFLRLRDLGEMIGFGVGYDEATRTVLITSK